MTDKERINSRKSYNFIVRRPLLAYFVLSYAFFWGFLVLIIAILGILRLRPDAIPAWTMPIISILGSWMPNLAAVTVTGVFLGREGIRQLLGKFFAYRIAVRWYFVALFPFPLAFAAAGLYRLAGGTAPGNIGLSVGFWAGLIISFNASLNLVDARGLGFGPTLPLLAITAGIYLITAIFVWSTGRWPRYKTQGD